MGRPHDLYRQWDTTHYLNESAGSGLGFLAQRLAEEDAEHGSNQLRESINSMFAHWERRHGFQSGAGKILLPAGYNPRREAA